MSLIGCKLSHVKWGVGIVEQHTDTTLSVRFVDSGNTEQIKRFVYPDAIIQGHLYATDPRTLLLINKSMQECTCSVCGIKNTSTEVIGQKRLCNACKKSHMVKVCSFCDSIFEGHNGYWTYDSSAGKYICVCSACFDEYTFECAWCGGRDLTSYRVNSKYVPASRNLCICCVDQCHFCNEAILRNDAVEAFGHYYCLGCWEKTLTTCSYCGNKFLPAKLADHLCPDCTKTTKYLSLIKTADYLLSSYITIKYGDLEEIDRCVLFTKLYKYTVQYVSEHIELRNYTTCWIDGDESGTNPFYYVVLRIGGHNAIVTWLPHKMVFFESQRRTTTIIPYSKNITLTELRRKKYYDVCLVLDNELERSTESMDTSAGCMKIFNRPVLLRVQTGFNKNYGKQWNGSNDYIDVCNYGDTTDFWIIGALES